MHIYAGKAKYLNCNTTVNKMRYKKGITTRTVLIGLIVMLILVAAVVVIAIKLGGRSSSLLDSIMAFFRFGGAGE